MILTCKCTHDGQDALHGRGNRVHNLRGKTEGNKREARCTVCGNIRDVPGEATATSGR